MAKGRFLSTFHLISGTMLCTAISFYVIPAKRLDILKEIHVPESITGPKVIGYPKLAYAGSSPAVWP